MSKEHLIPEQRADRNGNVVTRWVKRVFADKGDKTSIPPVKLPSMKERYMSHMESDLLKDKLTDGLPKEYLAPSYNHLQPIDELAKESLQRHADSTKRRLITSTYKDNDLEKLQLLDKYMSDYDPHILSGTLDRLRKEGVVNIEVWITPDRMHAVTDFFNVAHEAERDRWGDNPRWDPEYAKQTETLGRHVTMHPKDGAALGTILKRGVRDARTALTLLKDFKSDGIPDSLNDGLL